MTVTYILPCSLHDAGFAELNISRQLMISSLSYRMGFARDKNSQNSLASGQNRLMWLVGETFPEGGLEQVWARLSGHLNQSISRFSTIA
jgi:5-methylcytosine-specific restriction endonuclease McrBC regulatory subunit McrC